MKHRTNKILTIFLVGGGLVLAGAPDSPLWRAGGTAWAAEAAPPATPEPPKPPSPPAPPAKEAPSPRKEAPDIQYERIREMELPARKLPKAGITEIRRGPEAGD